MKEYGNPVALGRYMALKRMEEAIQKQVDISRRYMEDKELYEGKQSDAYEKGHVYHEETVRIAAAFRAMLEAIRKTAGTE